MTADVRALVADLRDALAIEPHFSGAAPCVAPDAAGRDPDCPACQVLGRADAYLAPPPTTPRGWVQIAMAPGSMYAATVADPREPPPEVPYRAEPVIDDAPLAEARAARDDFRRQRDRLQRELDAEIARRGRA